MSSTNRGGKRTPADNYPTPAWCVHRLLEDDHASSFLRSGEWLEPGAGDGSIIKAVNEVRTDISWTALEIREECGPDLSEAVGAYGKVVIGDFLKTPADFQLEQYAVAAGNPPYWQAAEFIERSMEICYTVVLLLRVNFLASGRRNSFMRANPPNCYVLPNRPSFRGHGTDSPEYAWFLWNQEFRNRASGTLKILNTTSKEIRRVSKASILEGMGKRDMARRAREQASATPDAEIYASSVDSQPSVQDQ